MSKFTIAAWIFAFALIGAISVALSGSKLSRSNQDILMGYRMFEGDISVDRLSFSGAALSFLKADDPTTYVPYYFAFNSTEFSEMPDTAAVAQFQQRRGLDTQISSGVVLDSCVDPRPFSTATEDEISLIFPTLCRINSGVDGGPSGIIGVILPVGYRELELDGQSVCRAEAAHWLTLDSFDDPEIVLCVIVDQPYVRGSMPQFWMDIIFYQQHAGELYTLRAETRNFQHIN